MEIISAFVSGLTLLFLGSLNSATDYTESQHKVAKKAFLKFNLTLAASPFPEVI